MPPIEICYGKDCCSTNNKNPIVDVHLEINRRIDRNISIRLENKESGGGTANISFKEKGSEKEIFVDLEAGQKSNPTEYRGRPILLIGK